MKLWKSLGRSFLGDGDRAPRGPCLPNSLPSPSSQTPTSWQEQESHDTSQRKTCESHLTNKIWHTAPARNLFSLRLVMIWVGKVAQRLRSGGAALLGNLGAEAELPIARPNQWKGSVWTTQNPGSLRSSDELSPDPWYLAQLHSHKNLLLPLPSLSEGYVINRSWAHLYGRGRMAGSSAWEKSLLPCPPLLTAQNLSRVKLTCSWGKTGWPSSRTEILTVWKQPLHLEVVQVEWDGLAAEELYENKGVAGGSCTVLQIYSCCKSCCKHHSRISYHVLRSVGLKVRDRKKV